MPIDSKETKETILLETAFTPAAVPNVDPGKITALYDGKPPYYTEEEEKQEIDIFNHQITQLITVIEKACKKLGIEQVLLDNLQTFSNQFQSRVYPDQTALFYIAIKQSLEKIAVCLSDDVLMSIGKKQLIIDFLSEIQNCGSGTYNHINTATISFLTLDTIEIWLALFRRNTIRKLADHYIKNKKISIGNSVHMHNVFLLYACEQGWHPYGFDPKAVEEKYANLVNIAPGDFPGFHKAFLEAYNPSAIMRELATLLTDRILTRITDSIAKKRKAALKEKAIEEAKSPAAFAEEKKPSSSVKTTLSHKIPSESYIEIKSTKEIAALEELDALLNGLPLYTKKSGMHTIFDTTDFSLKEKKALDELDEKKQEKPVKPTPFILFDGQKLTPKPISTLMVALTNYLITQNNPLFETVPEGNYTLVPGYPEISYKHNFEDPAFPIPLLKRSLPLTCKNILVVENAPALEDMKADTLQLLRNKGKLIAYWMENTELMSHYFDESEVQDIIQKLPEIETISDDIELMEMVAAKYGNFPCDIDVSILKKNNILIPISNTSFEQAYAKGERNFAHDTLDGVDLTKYNINDFIFTNNETKGEEKKVTLYNVKVTPLQYLHLFHQGIAITKLRYDEKDLQKEMPSILELKPLEKGMLLFFAITNNLPDLANDLLKARADTNVINFSEGNQPKPIHMAATKGLLDIVKALLVHNPSLLQQIDAYCQTPLLVAAAEGNVEVVDYLIKQKPNLNAFTRCPGATSYGKTALYWATENGHAAVVAKLVQAGAITTSVLDTIKHHPIHIAAEKGDLAVVKAFIENVPAEKVFSLVNQMDAFGHTPLIWAAYKGRLAVVDYLLKKDADLNACTTYPGSNDQGKTALYWAVEQGHADVAARLIQAGAATTITLSGTQYQPLHLAARRGNLAMVKALLENVPPQEVPNLINKTSTYGETPLMLAAAQGYLGVVDYLLIKGANINASINRPGTPDHDKTALFFAIENGQAEVVAPLVIAGAMTTTTLGEHKHQPIHIAALKGDLAVVKALIENIPIEKIPELLNQTNALGQTPLMLAAKNGHLEVADYFIKKKAKLNATTELHKKTALDYAVENGQAKVAARLIQAGASTLTVLGEEKFRPIHIAALKGDLAMVQALIENDPGCLNQKDAYNQTPLMLTSAKGHSNVANYLINKKANLKPYTKKPGELGLPKTALDLAIEGKHDAVIASLIQVKAPCFSLPPSPTMKFHRIHIAAQEGQLETLMVLLAEDPTLIDQPDAYGQTPLLWAAAKGHLSMVKYLIAQGAKLDCATQRPGHKDHGKTALYWAAENGHPAVVKKLLELDESAFQTSPCMKYHPIHLAAYKGNLDAVKEFAEDNPSLLDKVDGSGRTPLLWAINQGHLGLIHYLIKKKINSTPNPSADFLSCYEQNFDKLYTVLQAMIGTYERRLPKWTYYTDNDLYKKKLAFIKDIQDRLQHNRDQRIETKLQTVDEVYKLIAANEDLGKHRSILSMLFSQHMFTIYAVMIILISAAITAAPPGFFLVALFTLGWIIERVITDKWKHNTAKFWKPEGYKQKERVLSEMSIFKNKTKKLEHRFEKTMPALTSNHFARV